MIQTVFGVTESGKSFHANRKIASRSRNVVFDVAHCFSGGTVIEDFSEKTLVKIYDRFSRDQKYMLIFRAGRSVDLLAAFDRVCALSTALGRTLGKGVESKDRLLLTIDEADHICTANTQSWQLKTVVNKGRHDNVDTMAIARAPQRIHTDLRINCTELETFKITHSLAIKAIEEITCVDIKKYVTTLAQYSYLRWTANGNMEIFDRTNKSILKVDYFGGNHGRTNKSSGL